MEPEQPPQHSTSDFLPPIIETAATLESVLRALHTAPFEEQTLPEFVQRCRWFGGKAHALRRVKVLDTVAFGPAATGRDAGRLAFLQADYHDVPSEVYVLPLQLAPASSDSHPIIARLRGSECVLFDALNDESFRSALFEIILGEKRLPAGAGELAGLCGTALKMEAAAIALPLHSRALKAEQSNSAIVYDGRFFLKLYRKPELGENPDAELLRFLSERQKFEHVPAYCGAIEHRVPGQEPRVLALLVANVPNEGDAWTFTLGALGRFFERLRSQRLDAVGAAPALVGEIVGDEYPERACQLAQRTAQMHLALAADSEDPHFAPEPFSADYQRSLHGSMCAGTRRMTMLLERKLDGVPAKVREEAASLLQREEEILRRQAGLLERTVAATRIRHHGDYHLGQMLNTGRDFIIIDFEGEPARSISERRMKHSPLRDVAGMLRSFHYAAHTALAQQQGVRAEDAACLDAWAEIWAQRIGRIFLEAYLATARGASFIPADPETLEMLLEAYLLEKAAYEVCYELNNRPDWIFIPVRGITRILDGAR